MISEDTLKQIQAKTSEFLSATAQKMWEHKFALIPIAILGYGFIKNNVSLKTIITKPPQETELNRKSSSDEIDETVTIPDKRKYKRRIHVPSMHLQAKLSSSVSFKEEVLMSEEVLTPCKFVKDTEYLKTPLTDKVATDSTHSGYHSDVESMIQENDIIKKSEFGKTSNPDDLFFTIYQQLK